MHISGKTKVVVLLAHPVDHVRSPGFFNQRCVERNIDAVLVPWDVMPDDLSQTVEMLRRVGNLAGVVVTIPHKETISALCDELTGDAEAMQVCNVVRKTAAGQLVGGMYDGVGFVEGMRRQGLDPRGRKALLAGCGGAAIAVAHALVGAGVERLTVSNRTVAKAERLVNQLRERFPEAEIAVGDSDPEGYDLLVNGTSLGMKEGDPLPIPTEKITGDMIAAEVVMQPEETRFLQEAGAKGAQIHRGVHMLTTQVDLIIDHLFGE